MGSFGFIEAEKLLEKIKPPPSQLWFVVKHDTSAFPNKCVNLVTRKVYTMLKRSCEP